MSDEKRLERRKKKFAEYGFDESKMKPMDLPDPLPDEVDISPLYPTFKDCFTDIPVKDMEHLKQLVGVPSSLSKEKLAHTITDDHDVHHIAKLAMHGDWENDLCKYPRAAEVEKYALGQAKTVSVGTFSDLVVKDNQKVTLNSAPTYYFDNITVYGTGEIILGDHVKLIVSGEVKYVPKGGEE